MKANRIWGLFPAALCLAALLSVSCQEKEPKDETVKATVSGTVVDDQENPLEGVKVTFVTADSKKEQKAATTTDAEGKYSVEVPSTGRVVSFEKDGYATFSTTIAEARFAAGAIKIDAELIFSQASIEGKVVDLESNPYEGVKVTCADKETTTDAYGTYKFEGLTIKEYTLNFSDAEGSTAEVTVSAEDFEKGVAYVTTVTLGTELLPGLSYTKLAQAPKWYGNDFAGGRGAFCAQWNNVGFLSGFPIMNAGNLSSNEGVSLNPSLPYPNQLGSYFYGRKLITEGNCYVHICARSFSGSADAPARLNIAVIDLGSSNRTMTYLEPQITYSGYKKMKDGTASLDAEQNLFVFDLSEFKDKTIGFGLGVMGDNIDNHGGTMICRIAFGAKDMTADFEKNNLTASFEGDKPSGYGWPGFTKSNLSSFTPNDKTSFSGCGMGATWAAANQEGTLYKAWLGTNHLAVTWNTEIRNEAFTPLKDNLFCINGNYGKYSNYDANNWIGARFQSPKAKLTVKLRTYNSDEATLVKISVVDLSDFSVTSLVPTNSNLDALGVTALDETAKNCLAIKHCDGGEQEPDKLAALTFDLSAYAGKDVVITISNHSGQNGASKDHPLAIYSVDFAD